MTECEINLLHNHDTTLERWYRRKRTDDAPLTAIRLYKYGRKIWWDDFRKVIEPGELEGEIIRVLKKCFKHFDKSYVPEGKATQDGFVDFYRLLFRNRLLDLVAGQNARRRRRTLPIDEVAPPVAPGPDDRDRENEWNAWSRHLIRCVLPQLPPRMQQIVKLRHIKGLKTEEVVALTGITADTIKRHYGLGKISKTIRKKVNLMIFSIPIEQLDSAIYYLAFEQGFSCKHIADLFCIDEAIVKQSTERSAGKIIDSMNREGAMLFVMPK